VDAAIIKFDALADAIRPAVRSDDVAFLIMLAGPAQPFDELMAEQSAGLMRVAGAPEEAIQANIEVSRRLYAVLREEPDNAKARERFHQVLADWKWNGKQPELQAQLEAGMDRMLTPEIRSAFAYSAADTLSKLRCPVLALFGGKDLQVPADSNLRAAAAAFAAGHVASVTLVKLPGLNHLFQTAVTGSFSEYASLAKEFTPGFLDLMTGWITKRVAVSGGGAGGRGN